MTAPANHTAAASAALTTPRPGVITIAKYPNLGAVLILNNEPETDTNYRKELDTAAANWVAAQLNAGNDWAWCFVEVRLEVEIEGTVLSESDYLGACSYKGREDFINNSGYYEDMVDTVLSTLTEQLDRIAAALSPVPAAQ